MSCDLHTHRECSCIASGFSCRVQSPIYSILEEANTGAAKHGNPDHLLITSEELADILRNFAPVVVADAPAGPEWQTMDTAPKDGRHILLYCEYYGIGRCAWESWRGVWRSDDPNHGIGFPEPTHWMQLPDFPVGSVRAENARRAALAASVSKGCAE